MSKITRNILRGKPLDTDCYSAKTAAHERGMDDNRIFCYGLEDAMTDEPLQKCKECDAWVENEEAKDRDSKASFVEYKSFHKPFIAY